MVKVKQLVWDNWNIKHIKKHKVSVKEIEEACKKPRKALRTYEGRLLVLGETRKQRELTIVLAPEQKDKYYVVTARDMSKKEKRLLNDQS